MLPAADREIRPGLRLPARRRTGMNRFRFLVSAVPLLSVAGGDAARAGPPFLTDDPEPVELGHWELYVASRWSLADHAAIGSAPHCEVNYGALPELQLHALVPATLAWQSGEPIHYGLGDIELGAKLRFLKEGDWRPQIGTFPLVLPPTGSAARGLGAGKTQVLLPIWIQKSFGEWTTYGGGGVHFASGDNAVIAGWLLQRHLLENLSLGTEAYVTIPINGGPTETQLNLGLVLDVSALHHVLASGGPAFGGSERAQAYLAYQLTI
jgi:hypothetical protein